MYIVNKMLRREVHFESLLSCHTSRSCDWGERRRRRSKWPSWKFLFVHSCFTKSVHKFPFPPTQTRRDSFLTWSSWLFLSLIQSRQNSLAFSLLHCCWGQSTSLSCWLAPAFPISLCNVPGCTLHIYIVPSKYIHKLLCRKTAYAGTLSTYGLSPSRASICHVFWTVAPTCQFNMGWIKLFLTLLLTKNNKKKDYLSMWQEVLSHHYDLIQLRLPCL